MKDFEHLADHYVMKEIIIIIDLYLLKSRYLKKNTIHSILKIV